MRGLFEEKNNRQLLSVWLPAEWDEAGRRNGKIVERPPSFNLFRNGQL